MKKIVLISDSHNNTLGINKLLPIMDEADYVISLGDTINDQDTLEALYGDKLIAVKGNCDNNDLPLEKIIDIDDVKLLLTHGHNYRVKTTLLEVIKRVHEIGANAVFFGHTHIAVIEDREGVKLINPGAMWNRGTMSYCYIVIVNGSIIARVVTI